MAKNTNGYLVAGGLLGLGIFGWIKLSNKQQAVERLSYALKEVRLKLQKGVLLVRIDLDVNNPTSEVLKFKDFSGSLFADTQKLGDITIPNPVNIVAKGITPVQLSAFIPAGKLVTTLLSTLTTMALPTAGYLKGTIRVGNLQIPVDEEFKFNEPKKS